MSRALDGRRRRGRRWVTDAAVAASHRAAPPAGSDVVAEVYHNFSCPACRTSALALDSVRTELGPRVSWRLRFVTRGPRLDPVGYHGALVAACLGDEGAYALFKALTGGEFLDRAAVDAAASSITPEGVDLGGCVSSRDAMQRVGQDSFDAHADGIVGTPTLRVNGLALQGPLAVEPLREFLGTFLTPAP